MVKSNTTATVKEIENFEEYGNKLMEKIIGEKFDWTIDEENYLNSKKLVLINSNNFTSEQNEQIKNEIISLQLIKERGRAGKTVEWLISRIENETSYENKIEIPIKKS
jgi:phosphomevalonate kinase